jgi:hypothetical protein
VKAPVLDESQVQELRAVRSVWEEFKLTALYRTQRKRKIQQEHMTLHEFVIPGQRNFSMNDLGIEQKSQLPKELLKYLHQRGGGMIACLSVSHVCLSLVAFFCMYAFDSNLHSHPHCAVNEM